MAQIFPAPFCFFVLFPVDRSIPDADGSALFGAGLSPFLYFPNP